MVSSKSVKIIIVLVAFNWILAVNSTRVHSYAERPSTETHTEYLSESEINAVLKDPSERQNVQVALDQITYEMSELVPTCRSKHLYDATAKVCSMSSTQGHCGNNMIFFYLPGSYNLGACACGNLFDIDCFGRPRALTKNNECGYIGTQGPCDDGKVMAPITKLYADCDQDACLYSKPENAINFSEGSQRNPGEYPVFNFTYFERCYTSESEAFCERGQVVRFIRPYKSPVCVYPHQLECQNPIQGTLGSGSSISSTASRDCDEGLVLDSNTNICRQMQQFTFE